ncbi:MAG: hypothetical protein ACFFFB_21380, partial [Candidatus Heimdallarchaeota archaeon]
TVIQQAFNLASPLTGKVVMHGIYEDTVPIDFLLMVGKQITLIGSYGYTPIEVKKSIELLKNKSIDRSQIITHKFSLDHAKKAFEASCKTNESVKVLITP